MLLIIAGAPPAPAPAIFPPIRVAVAARYPGGIYTTTVTKATLVDTLNRTTVSQG